MAKTETLVDHFATSINSGVWGGAGTGVTWVDDGGGSGHVECSVDTSVRSLYTVTTYDLTASYVYAKVGFPAAGNGTKQCAYEISDSQTAGTNRLRFYWTGTNLRLVIVTGGSEVAGYTDLTYSATDHAWLRFREASGTAYWDTAPDVSGAPGTWTQRHSQAIPTWGTNLTVIYPRVRAFHSGAEDVTVVTFDNVNFTPATEADAENAPVGVTAYNASAAAGTNAVAGVAAVGAAATAPSASLQVPAGVASGIIRANGASTVEAIKLSSLNSSFTDNAQWNSSGGVTREPGTATIPGTTSYLHCWSVNASLSMDGSFLSAKMTLSTGTGRQYYMYVESENFDSNDQLFFLIDQTTIYAIEHVAGASNTLASTTYSAASHLWMRIRHDATFDEYLFEVSGDGETWVEFASTVAPTWNKASVAARFAAGRYSGTDGSLVVSNVNETAGPVSVFPGTITVGVMANNATATVAVVGSAQNAAVGSVANNASPIVSTPAGVASASVTAYDASAIVGRTALAEAAAVGATANNATAAGAGSATAATHALLANDATSTVSANTGISETGVTANDAHGTVQASAGVAAPGVTANDASATRTANALAEAAHVAASAPSPAPALSSSAGAAVVSASDLVAGGSATPTAATALVGVEAQAPKPNDGELAETATLLIQALDAAGTIATTAETATAGVEALDASAGVGAYAECAEVGVAGIDLSGVDVGAQAGVAEVGSSASGNAGVSASVGVAEATVSAFAPSVTTTCNARAQVAGIFLRVTNASGPGAIPTPPNGWYSMIGILRQAEREVISDEIRPPESCPNDGEPLRTGPGGQIYCPYDGWLYPQHA